MKKAAFFDIDGTLYREGLITEVFKKFVTYELVDANKWHDEVKPSFMKYDRRQGEYDDYLNKMIDIYKKTLIGLSSEHILHIANTVIKQKGERVYTFTRDQILKHKEDGTLVIAVSGSPLELVEAMARKHQFDDWRGTTYVTDEQGKYTGEVIPMERGKDDAESDHPGSVSADAAITEGGLQGCCRGAGSARHVAREPGTVRRAGGEHDRRKRPRHRVCGRRPAGRHAEPGHRRKIRTL